MGEFFTTWPTWEKLCFVLACAIVVTLLMGGIKLAYTHWNLRKYSAVAEREKQDQAMQRQMSQRRPPPPGTEEREVPFGVRAIESGVEVEGVWISRNNTPEPASRETSADSSLWEHMPRKDFEFDIERRQVSQDHDRRRSGSTGRTARPASSGIEEVSPAEQLSNRCASRDLSHHVPMTKPLKSHPPSALSKFTGTPYLAREDSALSQYNGLEMVHRASGPMRSNWEYGNGDDALGSNESSNQSSNDNADAEPIAASAPRLLNYQPRPRHQSADLDLMHSHRISQAAETGQLTPRVRRLVHSVDLASVANAAQPNGATESGDCFIQPSVYSPSPTNATDGGSLEGTTTVTSRSATSVLDSLPAAVRRSSLPDVTSFAKFCQTAPPSPLPEGYRAVNGKSSALVRPRGDSPSIYTSAPSSPLPAAASSDYPETAHHSTQADTQQQTQPQPNSHAKRPSFEKRASDIVRGHGSGFEILKQGTFNPPVPGERPTEKPWIAPPISLHNTSRPRSSSTDSRKKLQKKRRRPSMESTSSFNTERESRASLV